MSGKKMSRLAVLISGNGSNLQSILDACDSGLLPARVVIVVANKSSALGLERARKAGVPALTVAKLKDEDRQSYDVRLAGTILAHNPDLIILAGWMRILSSAFLLAFPNQVINLHPALPGTFPGVNAIERAYEAFQMGTIHETGVMVHYVPDENIDCGPVIVQESVPIYPADTLEEFSERIHTIEHRLIVAAIASVIK